VINSTGGQPPAASRARRGRGRDPILQSKITTPVLPSWVVPRPRLERRITEGTQGPLTSITGPPGAGKTLAVAAWTAGRGKGPVAWVTVDGYDNRPEVFWSYVVAALRHAGVPVSRAASWLARGEATGHVFLLQLASALADQVPPVTLVLDDFHLLTDGAVLDGLAYLLKNARPGLRLLVTSRIDPPLPLHQYRLTGGLAEIRAEELAFSVPEVASLMVQHGVTLPSAALEYLTETAEGWAAGLRLAAMSMAGHPDPEQFVKNLSGEESAVTGYLVEEVLNVQTPEVRDLLLCTSVLEQMNAEIAGALLDRGEVAGTLEALARENSFVQPVGDGWYRFHSLFRDVLRLKLRRERPEIVAGLYRKAARWYQQEGMLGEAAGCAANAADWPFVAAIIVDEFAITQLMGPGHGDLPTAGLHVTEGDVSPHFLLAAAAVALSESGDEAADASLRAAEEILGRLPDDENVLCEFAACAIRSSIAFRRGSLDALDGATATAERLLDKIPQAVLARHQHAVAQVLSGRGTVELWSGNPGTAADLFCRAARLLEDVIQSHAPSRAELQARRNELAACRGYLALTEALRGRLSAAEEIASSGTALLGDGRARQPDPASALALALVSLEHGELSAARAQLKVADAALRAHPDRLASAIGSLIAARGSLAEGRARAAVETIERARSSRALPPLPDRVLTLTELQAHAAAGDGPAALAAARRVGPASAMDARVGLSRAWLAAGDPAAARRTLATVLESPADEGSERVRLDAWLADALLSFRMGDERRGRSSLEQALKLGEAEKRRLPFAMERSWLRPVLMRHPELAGAHRQLLGPGMGVPSAVPAQRGAPDHAAPVIVEQLSSRERDVLRHVAEMLDTADIAAEMYISVNTVKTHLKSIFRKLGASDRREAVRRARQLNLLLHRARCCGLSAAGLLLRGAFDCLLAAGHAQLPVDGALVCLDRVTGQVELPGDLTDGQRLAQQAQDCLLTLGQRLGGGRRAGCGGKQPLQLAEPRQQCAGAVGRRHQYVPDLSRRRGRRPTVTRRQQHRRQPELDLDADPGSQQGPLPAAVDGILEFGPGLRQAPLPRMDRAEGRQDKGARRSAAEAPSVHHLGRFFRQLPGPCEVAVVGRPQGGHAERDNPALRPECRRRERSLKHRRRPRIRRQVQAEAQQGTRVRVPG
jgi:LuxR family transcriptional regulator, maltose regulon positive regulatory protein